MRDCCPSSTPAKSTLSSLPFHSAFTRTEATGLLMVGELGQGSLDSFDFFARIHFFIYFSTSSLWPLIQKTKWEAETFKGGNNPPALSSWTAWSHPLLPRSGGTSPFGFPVGKADRSALCSAGSG